MRSLAEAALTKSSRARPAFLWHGETVETVERELRELAHRVGDGFEATLLWSEHDGRLTVVVNDWRADERFEVEARADNALDVFHHPFAYRSA